MKRFPDLWKSYAPKIDKEVRIEGNKEEFLSPLDKVIPPLCAANEDVHRLQGELSVKKDYSVKEVKQANDVISPAEKAVKAMIQYNVRIIPFGNVAAKVVDAGNKLDDVVLNEIEKLERRFKNEYKKVKNWRESHGFENIDAARKRLEEKTDEFFELKKVYVQRGLPEKKIKSSKRVFGDYIEILNVIQEIEEDVQDLTENYQKISSLDDMKEFLGDLKKSGLKKKAKKAEYKECASYLNDFEKDVSKVLKDFDRINKKKRKIRSDIEGIERDYKELEDMAGGKKNLRGLRMIKDNLSPDRYQSEKGMIYLNGDIEEYRETVKKVMEKASWIDENKHRLFQESMLEKETISAKSPDQNVKERKYFEGLLKSGRGRKERNRLYIKAVDQETIERGSVDASSYFGISYNLRKLGKNDRYKELKDILNADRKASVDDLKELSSKMDEMITAEDFAEDKTDLEYIEGFYCCVKEPLRRGAFLRLRTSENEPIIKSLLDNFEKYIRTSRKKMFKDSSQYSKAG